MSDIFVIGIAPGEDSGLVGFTKARDNFLIVAGHFAASGSFPAAPVTGMLYADTAVASDIVFYLRQNGAWVAALIQHKCRLDLDFALFKATNLRLEHWGAFPTPAAGSEARIGYNTAFDQIEMVTASRKLAIPHLVQDSADNTVQQYKRMQLGLRAPAANAAGDNTAGDIGGKLHDAAADVTLLVLEDGAIPTPAAGSEARIGYNTAFDQIEMVTATKALAIPHLVQDAADNTVQQYKRMQLGLRAPAANAAGDNTAGDIGGKLHDAAADVTLLVLEDGAIPSSFVGDQPLYIDVLCALAGAETSGDDFDATGTFVSLDPAADDTGKAEEDLLTEAGAALPVLLDIGSRTAQFEVFRLRFRVPHNESGNVVAAGYGFRARISFPNLGAAGKVGNTIVFAASLLVPVRNVADLN